MTIAFAVVLALALVQTLRLRREHRLARTDPLTGLPNRRRFDEELARRRRRGVTESAVYVDVDGLKRVNDTLGHEAGDELLRRTAATLLACSRRTDLVARVAGDEFAVLPGPGSDAAALAAGLRSRLAEATVGSGSGERAVHEADLDMYRRKREKRAA